MVKVLENRAVDLDIAPGVKDGSELKNQADAVTYVGPFIYVPYLTLLYPLTTYLPTHSVYLSYEDNQSN